MDPLYFYNSYSRYIVRVITVWWLRPANRIGYDVPMKRKHQHAKPIPLIEAVVMSILLILLMSGFWTVILYAR